MMQTEHTVFECARWQNYRSELISTIGTTTAANIVFIMIASREIGPQWILRLKKSDL